MSDPATPQPRPELVERRTALRKAAYELPSPPAVTAPDLVNPHEPSEECGDTHCYSHGVDESDVGMWRACLECRHVYRSPEELRREWTDNAPPDLPDRDTPPPVEQIYFCPLCLHDW